MNGVVFDSNVCDGTDVDTAEAVDNELKKLDPTEVPKVKMYGQGTDTGGGGTSTRLATEIAKCDRITLDYVFLVNTCSIHNNNFCIKSPTEKHFDQGGVSNRTCL